MVTLGFGSRTARPLRRCVSLALLFLVGIASLRASVLTNCSETDLRVLLGEGGLVTVQCNGTITLSNTLIVGRNTTLDATGHQLILNGNDSVRVLYIAANVNFTAVNLMIVHGRATNGAGLYNDGGSVCLQNCLFQSNSANGFLQVFTIIGGGGGAVFNLGMLRASGCVFQPNSANGATIPPGPGVGGGMGSGGAIENLGSLSAISCAFLGNSATGGSGAPGMDPMSGTSGGTGSGGAVYNPGTLRIDQSLFASNSAVGGYGGSGFNGSAQFSINGGNGGPGGSAGGGALSLGGPSALVNCTLAWNGAYGANGGSGGAGAAVISHGGTFYGSGGNGASGGSGRGGAVEDIAGTLRITNCTIAYNRSTYGYKGWGGSGSPVGQPGASDGTAYGAVYSAGTVAVNNVLADNSPANGIGAMVDAGYNLSSDGSCAFSGAGSRNNTAALLGPLRNNGGPTPTIALLAGSPAIDAADTRRAPLVDQRGFPRPVGQAADIGAYEYDSVLLSMSLLGTNRFDVVILGVPGQSCELLSSSDLLSWRPIATNQFGLDGRLVFHDDPAAARQRFFRVRLP